MNVDGEDELYKNGQQFTRFTIQSTKQKVNQFQ